MKQTKIIVETKNRKYSILIGTNFSNNLSKIFKNNSISFNKCFLLIDDKLEKKTVKVLIKSIKQKKIIYKFRSSEKNKNINQISKILDLLQKNNLNRNDCLIAVGGGITGDTGGFAASLFKRGLKFINIPTTLLSQVDSSVGGKTGVNTKYGKNLIGSFYQPNLVIIDTAFLKTLPKREIISGYAEILKHAIISNKEFFKYLNNNVRKIICLRSPYIEKAIFESCKIKKAIVQKDENETDFRRVLNFGHTFAHAYEVSMNYSKKLNHGEAVILGIYSALKFGLINKVMKPSVYNAIINHFDRAKLSYNIKKYFSKKDTKNIVSYMKKDKKNNSLKINLVLLKKIGDLELRKSFSSKQVQHFINKSLMN